MSKSKLACKNVFVAGNPPMHPQRAMAAEQQQKVIIYPAEAIHVFYIFERFAAGDSRGKISASLARMNVLSPTGKEIRSKKTISKILNNKKYFGDVVLGKTQSKYGVQVKKPGRKRRAFLKVRISNGGCASHFKILIPGIISGYVMGIPMIRMENLLFMRSRLKLSA